MLNRSLKTSSLDLCQTWSTSPNISMLTQMMVTHSSYLIEEQPDDNDAQLIHAIDVSRAYYTEWFLLPSDHYRFIDSRLLGAAYHYLPISNMQDYRIGGDKPCSELFLILEKIAQNKLEEREKIKYQEYSDKLSCLFFMQGSRQPSSPVYEVPYDVMQKHIFPKVFKENIANKAVSIFKNHLSSRENNNDDSMFKKVASIFF